MILSAPAAISLYPILGLRTLLQAMSTMMVPAFIFIVAVNKKWLVFQNADSENTFIQVSIPLSILVVSLCQQTGFLAVCMTAF